MVDFKSGMFRDIECTSYCLLTLYSNCDGLIIVVGQIG